MDQVTPDALLLRLATARDGLGGGDDVPALAFDGDGTLWSGDIGEDFFHAFVEHGDLRSPAVEAMRTVRRAMGLDASPDGGVAIAQQLFDGYLKGRVAERVICELIAWVCAGWRADEVAAFAARVHDAADMSARCRAELLRVLQWGRGVGLELFLVSASPRPIVEAAGAPLGFDRAHILAATARFTSDGPEGVMLPDVVRPIPYGDGKIALLRERLAGRPLLAAFGDNIFDVPMLAASRVPVVVEPKPRLTAHLAHEADAGFLVPPVRLIVGG